MVPRVKKTTLDEQGAGTHALGCDASCRNHSQRSRKDFHARLTLLILNFCGVALCSPCSDPIVLTVILSLLAAEKEKLSKSLLEVDGIKQATEKQTHNRWGHGLASQRAQVLVGQGLGFFHCFDQVQRVAQQKKMFKGQRRPCLQPCWWVNRALRRLSLC